MREAFEEGDTELGFEVGNDLRHGGPRHMHPVGCTAEMLRFGSGDKVA